MDGWGERMLRVARSVTLATEAGLGLPTTSITSLMDQV